MVPALEKVAGSGLSAETRQFAEAALLALSGKELHVILEGQKHVMLSCKCAWSCVVYRATLLTDVYRRCCVLCADQWDAQATLKRVNESLIARDYVTWFDLTNMKGGTVLPLPPSLPPSHSAFLPIPLSMRLPVLRLRSSRYWYLYVDRKHHGRDERCDRGG